MFFTGFVSEFSDFDRCVFYRIGKSFLVLVSDFGLWLTALAYERVIILVGLFVLGVICWFRAPCKLCALSSFDLVSVWAVLKRF